MDELLEARKRAESAVSDMEDPQLRTTAFQVILQHLLSRGTTESTQVLPTAHREAREGPSDATPSVTIPKSTSERILALRDEGFLDPGRGIGEIRDELQAHGWMYALTALSGTLMDLVRKRQLRRVQSGDGKKKVYRYFRP
jgi:hypothetical protein